MVRFLILFCYIGFFLPSSIAAENLTEELPEIRLLMGSQTSARINYEVDFVRLALEKSKDLYGGYSFTVLNMIMTYKRELRALVSDFGQITTTTIRPEVFSGDENAERLPQPFLKGLLGYRQCIIRKEDLKKFNQITQANHLKAFRIGQGRDWQDINFFKDNGFTVVIAEKFDALIPMLSNGRFDCLSLGILESEAVLNERIGEYPNLVIAPNLVIFYPLDVYAYVSKFRPDIKKRLIYGMEKAQKDGSADELFLQHFAKELIFLNNPQLRLISPVPNSELLINELRLIQ